MITALHTSVWIGPPHTIHEFIKHSKWFPSDEFAICRSNQVGWAELHKLMLRAEEEAVVLCGPYCTLDFILYTKWCSADRLPALYDILSIWQHHFLLACTFLSLNSRLLLSHTFHNNGTVVSHQDLWATKLVSWTVVRVFVQSRTSVRVMCEEQLLLKCGNTCAVWGFWSLSALNISLSVWICSAPLSETDKLQMCAAATCQKTRLAISCCQKKSMLLFRSRRAAVFAGARDGSGNVCTADRQTGGHCWTVEETNIGGGKWRQGLLMFWLPLLGSLVICPPYKQIIEKIFKMLSWKGNITIG